MFKTILTLLLTLILLSACKDNSPDKEEIQSPNTVSIEISWSDNSDNEDEFIISRKEFYDAEFTDIIYLESGTTIYIDEDLDDETTYCYTVSASNNYGRNSSDKVCNN